MSSEVCPFCGKTYKRLKSHLPHCKAAATSKTPPTKDHVKPTQTPPSSQLVAGLSEPAAKGKESTPAISLKSANTPQLQSQSSPSSTSLPPSTKKKKQKLSEQIKMAASASAPTSLMSSPALSQSPTVPKQKRKSLRAVIEAATSDRVTKGSLEGTRSSSGDLPSGSTPFLTDPLRSRTKAQSETSFIPDASFSPLSRDTKPKDAPKKKAKTKRAAQPLPTTKDNDSKINESSPRASDNFWVDDTGEMEDLSGNKIILKSGGGHQARITIQDVKATLGRAKSGSQSRRASILSQVETTDNISSKTKLDTSLSPNQKDVVSCLITSKTLSDQLPSVSSQHTEQQSAKRKSLKSKQASLIPVQHDVSSQPKPTFPAAPLLSGHLTSQVSRATRTVSRSEGLTVGRHETKLLSISPSPIQFSSPHLFPLAPQTLPARAETLRADDGLKLEDRKQNAAHNRTQGAATQRSLGQVRLRELPEWLVCRTPSRPRDVVAMVQRGWQWYYRRYIDVRKGGVGGLGMLLAGYCVLSYIWSYPHIKRDRWRKYH